MGQLKYEKTTNIYKVESGYFRFPKSSTRVHEGITFIDNLLSFRHDFHKKSLK